MSETIQPTSLLGLTAPKAESAPQAEEGFQERLDSVTESRGDTEPRTDAANRKEDAAEAGAHDDAAPAEDSNSTHETENANSEDQQERPTDEQANAGEEETAVTTDGTLAPELLVDTLPIESTETPIVAPVDPNAEINADELAKTESTAPIISADLNAESPEATSEPIENAPETGGQTRALQTGAIEEISQTDSLDGDQQSVAQEIGLDPDVDSSDSQEVDAGEEVVLSADESPAGASDETSVVRAGEAEGPAVTPVAAAQTPEKPRETSRTSQERSSSDHDSEVDAQQKVSSLAAAAIDAVEAIETDDTLDANQERQAPSIDRTGSPIDRPGASPAEDVDQTQRSEPQRPAVDPSRFVSRVARAFEAAQQRGGGPIEIRLSPPELGAMQVRIELREGVLTASIETDTQAARNALLDNLPALRDRLAEQSIQIEKFDVDVRDENQGQQAQERETEADRDPTSGEERDSRGEQSTDPTPEAGAPASSAATPSINLDGGSINLVA